jgi:hypothetical protein
MAQGMPIRNRKQLRQGLFGGPPQLTLDNLTQNQLNKLKEMSSKDVALRDVLGFRLYDKLRFQAGAAMPVGDLIMFQNEIGNQQTVANNAALRYTKNKVDTNMIVGGQLPRGQELIVQSMQCRVIMSMADDAAYAVAGDGITLPTDNTPTAAVPASNAMLSVLEGGVYTFHIGEKDYEEGLLIHLPTPYGIFGFAGGGQDLYFEGVVNNGFGKAYLLPVARTIENGRYFNVKVNFPYSFLVARQFQLEICLEGILFRSVQ